MLVDKAHKFNLLFLPILCFFHFNLLGNKLSNFAEAEVRQRYTLAQALSQALEDNYNIKKAKQKIEQSEGFKIETRSNFIPHADFSAGFTRTEKDRIADFQNGATFGSQDDWQVQIEATQSVYSGGKNKAHLESSKHSLEAAKEEFRSVMDAVLLSVYERFYAALLTDEQVKVQEQHLKLLEEELKSEKSKLAVGAVSDFNVLRAEVELANAKTPLIRSRNEQRLSRQDLARVIGIGGAEDWSSLTIEIEGSLTVIKHDVKLDQSLNTAFSERPELKRLKALVLAEDQKVKVQESSYLPQLSVFVNYGALKSPVSTSIADELHGWQAGVRSTWSIFDGFATSARVQQALASKNTALLELSDTRASIEIEVRRAVSFLEEANELLSASQEVVKQAEESLRLAQARLQAGTGTQLEVLDTQVALTSARTNQIQAKHDYLVAWARLEKATGKIGEK